MSLSFLRRKPVLDFTVQNVYPFRRNAHAAATKVKTRPELRGGYLQPYPGGSRITTDRHAARLDRLGHGLGAVEIKGDKLGKSNAAILHERVQNLVETAQAETNLSSDSFYLDEELQALYLDILAEENPEEKGEDNAKPQISPTQERKQILEGLAQRLFESNIPPSSSSSSFVASAYPGPSTSLAARLSLRRQRDAPGLGEVNEGKAPVYGAISPSHVEALRSGGGNLHHNILSLVEDVVRDLEDAYTALGKSNGSSSQTLVTPVAILFPREWDAVINICLDKNDVLAAEHALDLLRRSGSNIPEKLINDISSVYARNGNVPAIESLFNRFIQGPRSSRQRDLHIKAHIKSALPDYNLDTALATLHEYEAQGLMPSRQTYTRCIAELFSSPSTQRHAQAWDLFAHMRYVAHPRPDTILYTQMIRACAGLGVSHSSIYADPLRALDLWTEMTQDARLAPTIGAYNAIILACARTKEYVPDAFRFAKEMLDSHRDGLGNPSMRPDRDTFMALLVAAKTSGDLPRARWILAEMLNHRVRDPVHTVALDEEIVMHVLHAYASYLPPFVRERTKIVEDGATNSDSKSSTAKTSEKKHIELIDMGGRFGVTPPQTHAASLGEAKMLFERIIEEVSGKDVSSLSSKPFSQVVLTPRLLNSYLSVYYKHGTLEQARDQFHELFPRLGVERTARTYVEALERCSNAKVYERDEARKFANELWTMWGALEEKLTKPSSSEVRLIERAYTAIIRAQALVGELDRAMALVRFFANRFTPQNISTPPPQPTSSPLSSRRVSLFAPRPLVRLTHSSDVPDDSVPPLLVFRDLELLHHRLATAPEGPRTDDLAYLKWLCMAYEFALRKRRDRTIST